MVSLSFTISFLLSFAPQVIKRSYLGVKPQRPNQPTQLGIGLQTWSHESGSDIVIGRKD